MEQFPSTVDPAIFLLARLSHQRVKDNGGRPIPIPRGELRNEKLELLTPGPLYFVSPLIPPSDRSMGRRDRRHLIENNKFQQLVVGK